ncbi:hypothetical protein NPIL_169381 [Nephila pilipes]|uniref:Uncharacterized protein n=1 Tax=Nephila pilipes TaxID=299642 RepID=A0A8X6UBB0_NEPPI|nr:hypothetical protein NPIL_169381 [Nephila pilipes]
MTDFDLNNYYNKRDVFLPLIIVIDETKARVYESELIEATEMAAAKFATSTPSSPRLRGTQDGNDYAESGIRLSFLRILYLKEKLLTHTTIADFYSTTL